MEINSEDYLRFDKSPIWFLHKTYFLDSGLKPWTSGKIPYTGISNYQEALKKAHFFVNNLRNLNIQGPIQVLELACGNGEFAKNFCLAFKAFCQAENLNYFENFEYCLSDFAQKTLDELQASKKFEQFKDKISYQVLDVNNLKILEKKSYDLILANYLLDQLEARVIAKNHAQYFEKYLRIEKIQKQKNFSLKKLKKHSKFQKIDLDKEFSLEQKSLIEKSFGKRQKATIVYSYAALKVLRNLLYILKNSGILMVSDFHASPRSGFDNYEPCYYGNSIAQPVNFDLIYKYFVDYQSIVIYEDPIKPLHTLILVKPNYPQKIELGKIYQKIYLQNQFLRVCYRYLFEFQLSLYLFLGVLIFALIWKL